MKFAALANMVTAALFALAAFEFNRLTATVDTLVSRVQAHEVQIARLELRADLIAR